MGKYFLSIIFFAISHSMFSANGRSWKTGSELSLEIAGVTVVSHYVSGEIPSYRDEEEFLSKFNPGALIRIFVKNTDPESGVNPEVLFNGKTGQELINLNMVSYCDVPDIRERATKMSTEIPAGAMDCYLLNVVNRNFYTNGINLKFRDKISGKTLISNRNSLAEIQRINREIRVVDDLLIQTVPYWWQNQFMNIDLNVLAGPDFAALFAIDLTYKVAESNQFVATSKRNETLTFKIPSYLNHCNIAVKIGYDGVSVVSVRISNGYAFVTDTFETTGMYILYNLEDKDLMDILTKKYLDVKGVEALFKFDPINDDSDFRVLTEDVNKVE